jgi:hypothetical protein
MFFDNEGTKMAEAVKSQDIDDGGWRSGKSGNKSTKNGIGGTKESKPGRYIKCEN